ncbi:MAG: deoxyribonuclease IV [Gemmatimonadota bacterium]|nr:MAG: deoxyribonuclease IV [Gemmatimonadota bacterium]
MRAWHLRAEKSSCFTGNRAGCSTSSLRARCSASCSCRSAWPSASRRCVGTARASRAIAGEVRNPNTALARTRTRQPSLLGAHVSTAGGVERAPARGAEIGADVIQIFTKQVNRWAERDIDQGTAAAFRRALFEHSIHIAGSHDSYLINLASPAAMLRERSYRSFCRELERCRALELDFLVSHPGNATDGEGAAGLRRNAEAIRQALAAVGGPTRVLIEATAGQGTALGSTFEELAELLRLIGSRFQGRLGVCLDTAHLFAAGYDLAADYEGVIGELDRVVGLERVHLLHLNDSKAPLGSRVDRHEQIGKGHLGPGPFRQIMRDRRFRDVPKVIETPTGDDPVRANRRNLDYLRRCART